MIYRVIAFVLALASPAMAVPVLVTSGEHDGFTRIVLDFGAKLDWQFGRTVAGYRFRPVNQQASYRLDSVFRRIGTSRLASISADPQTSELDIGFACACHAIPFEFRPGIIVIDLRDGPPPKGSSFEEALPYVNMPAYQDSRDPDPAGPPPMLSGYNWLQALKDENRPALGFAQPNLAPKPSTAPDLQPLRDQLLRQLSRGVSEGVIDLSLAAKEPNRPEKAEVEAARVALGELGGVETKIAKSPDVPLGAQGATCQSSQSLALYEWGGTKDAVTLLTESMTELVGEFDSPQPQQVTRAAQARLFLGFGQEARLILQAFPNVAQDEPVLMALSYILDGEAEPSGIFNGQGRCETAAALWASLADPSISAQTDVNASAVTLAFSALPMHLRQYLGPKLVDRFLALKDDTTAYTLRNMMLRAGPNSSAETALTEAKIDLAKGNPANAEMHLDKIPSGMSPVNAEALITRVNARVEQGLPVETETVAALMAMQIEWVGTEIGEKIVTATVLAQAASGDFSAAFSGLEDRPNLAPAVWQLLATLGEDSDFLTHSVATMPEPGVMIEPKTVQTIAARLLDLGLPDQAMDWMMFGGQTIGPLVAQIALARNDGRAALAALDESPQSADLRAAALAMLGDHAAAAKTLKPISQEAHVLALAQAKDWQALAQGPQSSWSDLAQTATQAPEPMSDQPDSFGPLARGLSLVEQSASTRAEIDRLLSGIAAN